MVTENLVNSYIATGLAAYESGQFTAAGKAFFAAYQKSKNYSKSDPRLAYVYANLSMFYYQQKRFKKCENLLLQAMKTLISADQFHTALAENVRVQLGNVYLMQQKYPQLIGFYRDCVDRYQRVGNFAEASKLYDRIIEIYCALSNMRQAESWCLRAIKDDQRFEMEQEPEAKKRLVRLAWIYTQQGRSQDAFNAYQKTMHFKPESSCETGSASVFPQMHMRTAFVSN
jgi:tetratricopeptide (TPR) repeat protein